MDTQFTIWEISASWFLHFCRKKTWVNERNCELVIVKFYVPDNLISFVHWLIILCNKWLNHMNTIYELHHQLQNMQSNDIFEISFNNKLLIHWSTIVPTLKLAINNCCNILLIMTFFHWIPCTNLLIFHFQHIIPPRN